MPLTPGTKLGQYEAVEPIGKGGMGEVYRARDTKLGRDVAIKVLPSEFARDQERLDRFGREARLLAQLNHANIATLHGFEEHDGQHFLVMELVEGETLAERIARRPLTANEAAPLFGQIADAIEAAHARGIVHRDLKPANIKLTADGRPKILDYGLARAWTGDVAHDADVSLSPTLTKGTELGTVMGTPAYMSPEQARGEAVDGRTDVWAFGCCLYESLTGKRAFPGETAADVFAAIMNRDPSWDGLPERLQKLLERCLQKDVHQRLRGLEHARLVLQGLATDSESPSTRPRAQLLPWLVAFSAATLALLALFRPARDTPEPSLARFSIQLPSGDRLMTGFTGNLAISRDGRRLAYVGIRGMEQYKLFIRSMDRLEPEPVPGTEGAGAPFFSPDGLSVVFGTVMGPLKRVAIGGGPPVELMETVGRTVGVRNPNAFWAPDGYIYFSPSRGSGIARIAEEGGVPEIVVPLREELGDVDLNSPHVLPGGEAVLFVARDGSGQLNIAVQSLDSGDRRVLIENGTSPHYAATGHLVFARAGKIMAALFDIDDLSVESNPITVVDGLLGGSEGPLAEAYDEFALSEEGTLAYIDSTNVAMPVSQLVRVDRQGAFTPIIETPRRFWDPRWSPDGRRIAVAIYDEQRWDLWTHDLSRETLTRLTFRGPAAIRPVWSADGSRMFYVAGSIDANGGGEPELTVREYVTVTNSVSRDGRVRVYRQSRPETGWDILFQRGGDDDDFEVYLDTPFDELHPVLSPDGRYLAYTSNESGRIEVFVDTFPQRSRKVQISNEGGTEPVWSPDGKELFYRIESAMMRVSIAPQAEFSASKPSLLFEGDFLLGFIRQTANYDIAPDGESFVMLRGIEGARGSEIAVVLNWHEELKRLVPAE